MLRLISTTTSLLITIVFVFLYSPAQAQTERYSAMQEETLRQQTLSAYPVAKWDSLRCAWYGDCANNNAVTDMLRSNACQLAKRMFGWHAIGTSSTSYVWQSLSDLSYFSYQVDYLTGNAVNATQLVNWGSNATVVAAKANGVNVNLAVTFFGTTTTFGSFFGNATAQQTLITNLVNHVVTADVKGLNIDFEGGAIVTASILPSYLTFLQNLRTQLLAARPDAEISIDIQGAHASNSGYITGLDAVVDLLILMGYDYYWSTQNYPGPIAPTWQFPKATSDPNGHGNVANDLNSMLRYAPREKVILAMPYYGRRWRTTNGCVLPADGNAAPISTQTYTQFRDNSNGYYNTTLRDPYSYAAYHCFNDVNAVANQQFIDDGYSLQTKYDLIYQRGLAGGAMWRLGYDAGYADLWDLINNNLSNCATMPCRDTIYDMGGPLSNYVNRSNYFFSIDPPGAQAVSLRFLSFDFEQGFDSVWIFNGPDTLSPRIGSFSGPSLPATVVAESGVMTIKVYTDGATTRSGFAAIYNCSPQLVRTVASGNWDDPQIWETGAVPLKSDTALIMPSHTVEVNNNQHIGKVELSATATVNVNSPAELKVGNE
ncbi:MAG: glycosyl hydrolase family 18 protein [Ferruginibacter sp.]